MHGPWHMPEHPDERDNSAAEHALEEAEANAHLEAFAFGEPPSLDELEHL